VALVAEAFARGARLFAFAFWRAKTDRGAGPIAATAAATTINPIANPLSLIE